MCLEGQGPTAQRHAVKQTGDSKLTMVCMDVPCDALWDWLHAHHDLDLADLEDRPTI